MSNTFSPEECERIMAEARANVERHRREREQKADAEKGIASIDTLPPFEDRVAKWKREGDEQMARQQQEKREHDYRAIERRVTENVRAEMLAVEQRIVDGLRSELLDVATTVRKAFDSLETNCVDQMDAKLARLDAMIKKLTADADIRTDLNALRESVKKLAGDGSVIDLPPLPSMRGAKLN